MFIEIETDMCLKEMVEAENIREWIKGSYISFKEECEDDLLKCLNLSSKFVFKDAIIINNQVFRIISSTKSFPRVNFSFHERNTIENNIKTLLTPRLTKTQPTYIKLICINVKCYQNTN